MEEQEQQNETQEEQNVQVEPTPLSEPPSHKKLIIGIVAGFVLVAGVAGAYFFMNQNIEGENTEVINIVKVPGPLDDITFEEDQAMNDAVEELNISDDWKTYRNEEYGFEFQYPGDWIFTITVAFEYAPKFLFKKTGIGLSVLPKGEFDQGLPLGSYTTYELIIGSKKAAAREWKLENDRVLVIINLNEKTIPSNWSEKNNRIELSFKQEDKEIIDQILSTFKFID